jgi:hypothetical protein
MKIGCLAKDSKGAKDRSDAAFDRYRKFTTPTSLNIRALKGLNWIVFVDPDAEFLTPDEHG